MPAPPPKKRPFNKRVRFTKQQELQLCRLRRAQPSMTYKALTAHAHVQFLLAKPPSLQAISRVLKTEGTMQQLTPDCLARKKLRPEFQLELDQSLVEFVLWRKVHQVSLSGHMLIAQAGTLAERHLIPSRYLPRFERVQNAPIFRVVCAGGARKG
ncbi:hypothetical protein PI124_g13736 [Phytophthora idaei]|nr:hypothetical protein PI124_g13736 [Phytophthora idaei]